MNRFAWLLVGLLAAGACGADERPPEIVNSIGMRLVAIPAGEFQMGSPPDEPGRRDRETLARVRISNDFHLGICEVTQAQYARVVGENPSAFSADGPRAEAVKGLATGELPVESTTWEQAVRFCRLLSDLPEERAAGRRYRLPTEAEWEYACRAGTTGTFHFGEDVRKLGDHAWYAPNSNGRVQPVGRKAPNAWGLHDLYGNVWEWCADGYADDYGRRPSDVSPSETFSSETSPTDASTATIVDPQGAPSATHRVIRGGGFASSIPAHLRSAARNFDPPHVGDADTGFRVVMEFVPADETEAAVEETP